MGSNIDDELKKLDEKIADAEENLGESEAREAHLAQLLFYITIGDQLGTKWMLYSILIEIGFFYMDFDLISKSIDKAKDLFEEGGDGERKNRLKVYEGLYCMPTRNFKKAASLFLYSISTFTTYELFPYDTFIFYTVLSSIVSLDRVSLKQKVVDAPEILTVIGKISCLSEFLNSLCIVNTSHFSQHLLA
ncbi:proteasome regulatory particle subunit [Ancistrocladus abbreviatus]